MSYKIDMLESTQPTNFCLVCPKRLCPTAQTNQERLDFTCLGTPPWPRQNLPKWHPISDGPKNCPDSWLFDSEALIKEFDRCREVAILIPARTHDMHFAVAL